MSTEDGYEEDDEEEGVEYGPTVTTDPGWTPKLFESNFRTTQLVFTKKNGRKLTSLRQPRDLYSSNAANKTVPRWPIESRILQDRPFHIIYIPRQPEPLYRNEKVVHPPHKSSDLFGRVVYDNSPDPEMRYFVSSKSDNKLPKIQSYYKLQDENDKTLLFESRFESGNLMRAVKVGEYDYQLWLKFDLYTKKHTQWYYFQVKNTRPNITYKFTIMNFLKAGSLYNEGLKPLLYSEKDACLKNVGWVRAGSNIVYYKNDIKVEENKERCYYSLHWTNSFPNEHDTYYFAHSYPYTYSDLQEYLSYLSTDLQRRKVCKQRILCETLAGNHVYVLTVTAPTKCQKQAKLKKAIVISARVHPGETVASWMMKGLLDYITSNEPDAIILRETFIFKIIPMLNPDGVVVGNYRCSLSGRDLNRNYKTVLKDSFPPVWSTRYLIKKLQDEREVLMYCDLHGHSRKKNVFIYGCENKVEKKRFYSRVFPLMLSKNNSELFSFPACRFRVEKSKEGTGRVVMWNMGIRYSYTLEASFCGSSRTRGACHFGVQDYEAMGYNFCDGLLDFFDPDTSKFNTLLHEIEERMQAVVLKKMLDNGKIDVNEIDINQYEFISELESDSFGSDSSVSDGLPMQILHASIPEISKKKRLKTRKERNKGIQHIPKTRKSYITTETATREFSAEKNVKIRKHSNKKKQSSKSTVQYRSSKDRRPVESVSLCQVKSKTMLLNNLTYSYVQAGLIDDSRKDPPAARIRSSTPSCEKCNPSYYLSFDASDGEHKHHNANLSLFDIRMPSNYIKANPTLELARRITAYKYRTGKAPPRMGKMFTMWASEKNRKEELLKKRTLNQENNVDYVRKQLATLNLKERFVNADHGGCYNSFETDSDRQGHKATTVDFSPPQHNQQINISPPPRLKSLKLSPGRKECLPKMKWKKNGIRLDPLIDKFDQPAQSHFFDLGIHQENLFKTQNLDPVSLSGNVMHHVEVAEKHDVNSKETKLKERLVSFGGSGTLVGPVRERKVSEKTLNYDTTPPATSAEKNHAQIVPQNTEQYNTSPQPRVLTPQQYCIFGENENQPEEIILM